MAKPGTKRLNQIPPEEELKYTKPIYEGTVVILRATEKLIEDAVGISTDISREAHRFSARIKNRIPWPSKSASSFLRRF